MLQISTFHPWVQTRVIFDDNAYVDSTLANSDNINILQNNAGAVKRHVFLGWRKYYKEMLFTMLLSSREFFRIPSIVLFSFLRPLSLSLFSGGSPPWKGWREVRPIYPIISCNSSRVFPYGRMVVVPMSLFVVFWFRSGCQHSVSLVLVSRWVPPISNPVTLAFGAGCLLRAFTVGSSNPPESKVILVLLSFSGVLLPTMAAFFSTCGESLSQDVWGFQAPPR